MKKLLLVFVSLLILFTVALMSLQPADQVSPEIFKQHPPIPTKYWVQQLEEPHPDGQLILRIDYQSDFKLPEKLNIYLDKNLTSVLRDDGVFPDSQANDMQYASIIDEDPNSFEQQYLLKQNQVIDKGYLFNFKGHIGKMYRSDQLGVFDKTAFANFEAVELNPMIINQSSCDAADANAIIKHKSLFITDLRVVEDPARTYNVVEQTGNPVGAWTFGQLMKNMAGGFSTPPTLDEEDKVKAFLKKWVLAIAETYELNDRVGSARNHNDLIEFMILPWLSKVYGQENLGLNNNDLILAENWEQYWDDADVHELLANAPFKLTAIVNRMDLRGNSAYSSDFSNSGETRFVYSLVGLYDILTLSAGQPTFHSNTDFATKAFIDWQGMNVILEYGNVESDKCDVKQRAQDWVALSSYNLDDELELQSYLSSLQELTATVTAQNANPNKPNGAAINQVRSNEKSLANASISDLGWENANWQLRQFEVDEEGWLVNAPVTNVPFEDNNFAFNNKQLVNPASSSELIDWIYGVNQNPNHIRLRHGNHSLPDNLTEPVAEIKDELMHYYGIDFWHEGMPTNIYDKYNDDGSASHREKEIRRQLSLNTCMGCHGGETKTPFTMIRPLGYGEEANYWDAVPSTTTGRFDTRFYGNANSGYTFDEYLQEGVKNFKPNYYTGQSRTIPNVSPFLTGRNYRGAEGLWQDDNFANDDDLDNVLNENNELGDNKLTGMFYVNDPSNNYNNFSLIANDNNDYVYQDGDYNSFPRLHNSEDGRVGFNDLMRRQKDLCNLAHSCCAEHCRDTDPIMAIIGKTFFIPLPENGH